MKLLKCCFILFLSFFLTCAVEAREEKNKAVSVISRPGNFTQRWAIVVGVGDYQDKSIKKLDYPEADAQYIQKILIQQAGFPSDHVRALIGKDAYREKFRLAIEDWLKSSVQKNDLVLFYFSGHGDYVSDDNYDEEDDEVDEALLPYDAQKGKAPTYIIDDSFNLWLSNIHAKKILIILDSCYSGESTRGIKSRGLEHKGAKAKGKRDGMEELASNVRINFAACAGDEQAYEFPDLKHGVFSFYVGEALSGKKADADKDSRITMNEVVDYVKREVQKYLEQKPGNLHQTPQISYGYEGITIVDLNVAFGGLRVLSIPKGAKIILDNADTSQVTEHTFPNLATGNHHVKLTLPGYEDYETTVYVPRGSTATVPYTLVPLPAEETGIKGKVLDPNGNPLGGVSVQVIGAAQETTTKPDGTFVIPGLEPGNYRISFSYQALGFRTRFENVNNLAKGETRDLNELTLQFGPKRPPVGAISVRAVGEDGKAITEATLYVDNALKSERLPATVHDLLVGIHEVKVAPKQVYDSQSQRVQVQENQVQSVGFTLDIKKGNLDIKSIPSSAAISIDGIPRGQTDAIITKLIEGTHKLKLEKPDFVTHTQSVDIAGDETLTLTISLKHLPVLAILARPAGATITLNGREIGKTKEGIVNFTAQREGSYRLKIEKEDYQTYETTVNLELDKTVEKNIELKHQTILSITSEPSGADVRVNGERKGTTPLKLRDIQPGEYEVKVSKSGYQDWEDAHVVVIKEYITPLQVNLKRRPTSDEEPTAPAGKTWTASDGAEMVLIRAGEFQMGSNDGGSDEKPVHTVNLDDFYMDKYEVTNEKYAEFLNKYRKNTDAAGHELINLDDESCLIEKSGGVYRPKKGHEDHPVVEVTWYGAAAYAQFYNKRLPTEAEWEKAARGRLVGKKYPWGDEIDPTKANYDSDNSRSWSTAGMLKYLKPVGSFPANGYELYDMAGNVWEWCADEYEKGYYSKSTKDNPTGPGVPILFVDSDFTNVKNSRVLRGGSWYLYPPVNLRCADRVRDGPTNGYFYLGFRCVVSSPSIPR